MKDLGLVTCHYCIHKGGKAVGFVLLVVSIIQKMFSEIGAKTLDRNTSFFFFFYIHLSLDCD